MTSIQKQNIAVGIAFTFHFCGAIGILFSPYKDWFINNTFLNLLLMVGLILLTQENKNKWFYLFMVTCFCVGFLVEFIGVNTHILFGNYVYGNSMGIKFKSVPIIIGLQWFVVIYCCGVIMNFVSHWAKRKLKEYGEEDKTTKKAGSISLMIDASLLATLFDYIIEPAAQKLGYWKWENSTVPFFNYTCWFFISAGLLMIFDRLEFNKLNKFAIHLFIIQMLFFTALRMYL